MSLTRRSLASLMCLALLGCGLPGNTSPPSPAPTAAVLGAIPLCDEVANLSAPTEYYRDAPIYVGNEMEPALEQIRAWARRQPGFQEIWIDRQHQGWITVAFSVDAEARQADLEMGWPGVGVVAVGVDWTMAELEDLQRRVGAAFRDQGTSFGAGQLVTKGVVSIYFPYLEPELVALANQVFARERVCLEGADPALAPIEGPQPLAGDGWRLLADQDETGFSYRTGIAYDDTSYEALWAQARLNGDRPSVDFQSEVVIWFGAVHGSSCPRLRLDGVVVDAARSLVHADITSLDAGVCTADAIAHVYVVALQRDRLPAGPFAIQLGADDPPGGAPEERTVVDVDLSAPGAVASPGDIHGDPGLPGPSHVGPGDYIETGFPWSYGQTTHCGLEWLGPLNDVNWRTTESGDVVDWVPQEWRDAVEGELLVLTVVINTGPPPLLTATANGYSVTYEATLEPPPGCD
jgi:hypothetical protein